MKRGLAWAASVAVALVFLAPILWMLGASLHVEARIFAPGWGNWLDPAGWTWRHYPDAWNRAALGRAMANSLVQVVAIGGVGLFVNALAAYAFARLEFPGREVLFAAVVALIVLPVEALAVPMFLTARGLGLTGGYARALGGLVIPFLAQAFNIYFLRQHFLAVPRELEEAAVVDGAGAWRRFWHVALPTVRPALATVATLDVLTRWGDFLWPLMIATREETRTVQLSLANLFTQPPINWGDIVACAVLTTLPVVAVFRWLQRYVVPGEVRAGIK